MVSHPRLVIGFGILCLSACDNAAPEGPDTPATESAGDDVSADDAGGPEELNLTLRSDVEPVTRADDALPGVVIPPFVECTAPQAGEPEGNGPNGKVCTPVSIAGCTEPGRYYPDYGDCKVVLTQRPFWATAPANVPKSDDPRLEDEKFMKELGWVTEQLEASACTCCHDSRQNDGKASQWDVNLGPIWTDTVSDSGLSLFTGLADSRALGAYPADQNNGFSRSATGVPTTDEARMKAFFMAELARRGITDEKSRSIAPFGGPVYTSLTAPPVACEPGEGVSKGGKVNWNSVPGRYVYVLEAGSDNPGVPPNLDRPKGTLWRLDATADNPPIFSGIDYGETPEGTVQSIPEQSRAPALEPGKTYQLYVLYDVGIASTNCLFKYEG